MADGDDGGFGCGRVRDTYKNHNASIENKILSLNHVFVILFVCLPFAVIRYSRSKVVKRKYKRYSVDFKGFVKTPEGLELEVEVFTFSIGGAGIRFAKSGEEIKLHNSIELYVKTPSGERSFNCRAVSRFKDQFGLCFEQSSVDAK